MPAIIFCDGFDTYTTILDKWDAANSVNNSTTPPTIIAGAGRGGAGAAFTTNISQASVNGFSQSQFIKNIGTQSTVYVGFAFNWNPVSQSGDTLVFQVTDSINVQVSLFITSAGTMYFTRGGAFGNNAQVTIGSATSTPFPSNSFHYIEAKITISSSVGVASLRIDQTPVLTQTGLNTQSTGNAFVNRIAFGSGIMNSGVQTTSSAYYDDIYIDTANFNGDVRVNGQVPSGNGTTQNFSTVAATWLASKITKLQTTIFDGTNLQRCTSITGTGTTGGSVPTWNATLGGTTTDNPGGNQVIWTNIGTVAHWKLVSESDPDGDSSYLQSNVANDIERFTFPAIVGANIATVIIWAFARKDDGGLRTIQGAIKSGATLGLTGTDVAPGTNYAYLMLQSINDPNTGAPWTLAAVNAAELGVKITN